VIWQFSGNHWFSVQANMLTLFGLFAVTAMLVTYALENRSPWFILGFAASCALGSAYGFLQGAWPFGVVEAIWSIVALRRWHLARRSDPKPIIPTL
jgi:hypothetical protein